MLQLIRLVLHPVAPLICVGIPSMLKAMLRAFFFFSHWELSAYSTERLTGPWLSSYCVKYFILLLHSK